MNTEWTDNGGGWGSVTVTMPDGSGYQADVAYAGGGGSSIEAVVDFAGATVDMASLPDGVLSEMGTAADEMANNY